MACMMHIPGTHEIFTVFHCPPGPMSIESTSNRDDVIAIRLKLIMSTLRYTVVSF
jgi:hypothetical protein